MDEAAGEDATDNRLAAFEGLDAVRDWPRDLDRLFEPPPITLRRKPRRPRSRSTSDSTLEAADDVGLESSSTTGERVV